MRIISCGCSGKMLHYSLCFSFLQAFDKNELLECIQQLVKLDEEWVPYSTSASLYIRPTFIGTESSLGIKKLTKALLFVILSPVGPYFSTGSFNPDSATGYGCNMPG